MDLVDRPASPPVATRLGVTAQHARSFERKLPAGASHRVG
jgi:hypothetical protein